MPRPPRKPGSPAVPLTLYMPQDVIDALRKTAKDSGRSPGELVEHLLFPPSPVGAFGVSDPIRPTKAAALGSTVKRPPVPIIPVPERDRPHPGWKLGPTGSNVCTACGKPKLTHSKLPCEGVPE